MVGSVGVGVGGGPGTGTGEGWHRRVRTPEAPLVGEAFCRGEHLRKALAVVLGSRRFDQRVPVVRRVPSIQLLAEAPVRVGAASVGAEAVLVVHPPVHNGPDRRHVPEEQPESTRAELVTAPVPSGGSERVALLVLGRCGSLRDLLKHRVIEIRHDLVVRGRGGSPAMRPGGVALLEIRDGGRGQPLKLFHKRWVEEQHPAVDDEALICRCR